jgi:hypothetical protein
MGPDEPLSSLENPERIAQIKENHQKSIERFEARNIVRKNADWDCIPWSMNPC